MKIYSIFKSMNGEICSSHQGSICTFIRLAGCNLKCSWCDTTYANKDKWVPDWKPKDIVQSAGFYDCKRVTITGGEPLMQRRSLSALVDRLAREAYHITIETNGSYPIPHWDIVDCWVADWKLPSSGMSNYMKLSNFKNLCGGDFVKFVINDNNDFMTALKVMTRMSDKKSELSFAFSPTPNVSANKLLEWMLQYNVNEILSLQLHKILKLKEDNPV